MKRMVEYVPSNLYFAVYSQLEYLLSSDYISILARFDMFKA